MKNTRVFMMKFILGAIMAFGMFNALQAQTSQQGLVEQGVVSTHPPVSGNEAIVNQVENENSVYVQQVGANAAQMYQQGYSNYTELYQMGIGNELSLNQQGNHNRYIGLVEGEDIVIEIEQNGGYNLITEDLNGKNLDFDFVQTGQSNEILHTGEGLSTISMTVIQRGNGMKLIIK